ncbi:MAG: ATP-dependent DNA helicase RecQ, partial [Spirochaetales bacterium]|nr:ATP-dependent DNA helicase RecQ [Spirochaetales bacterium]
ETILKTNMLLKLESFTVSHIVIDETHTVSEWGDTFRPVYLELSKLTCGFEDSESTPVVTAFTATASDKILSRVKEIVFPGKSPELIAANPDRPNISYRVIHSISKNRQLIELLTTSGDEAYGYPVLIFSRSRSGAELTACMLRERMGKDNIFFYHAGLDRDEKKIIEEWFFDSNDGILIATCAYGMGVDKKNIRTVIHMEPPLTVEAYLQESGRAGRNREQAEAVLMVSEKDIPGNSQGTNSITDSRYQDFIKAVTNSSRCRRESLLSLLGAESESCFGCDVCDKTIQSKIHGQNEILRLIKRYNRRLTIREAALTLAGSRYTDVFEKKLFILKGYESLSEWSIDDVKDAVNQLEAGGIIKIPKRGLYRNRLCFKGRRSRRR